MKYSLFILGFILVLYGSCNKPPIYKDEPTITWGKYSKDTIRQEYETVTFTIEFTDGDANIGNNGGQEHHIEIIDLRRNDTAYYRLPEIPDEGVKGGISGEIEIDVASVCCIDPNLPILCNPIPNTYQAVEFLIRIRDNAGNWSNEIITPALQVACF